MGAFRGRPITCGGFPYNNTCHEYEGPAMGWAAVGNLPFESYVIKGPRIKASKSIITRYGIAAFSVDRGLPTERLYFAGGDAVNA